MNLTLLKATFFERKIKQKEMAKYIDLSPKQLNLKFKGETQFTIQECNRMAEKLKLSEEEIINIFFR